MVTPFVGQQPLDESSTTARAVLGHIVQAKSTTYGVGEFVYLLGVASTTVGSVVTYNATTWQTALAPVGTNKPQPIAVAMSANLAAAYGWYQIGGISVMAKSSATCLVSGVAVGVKTVGFIATTGTGKEVLGALVAATASAASGRTTVQVLLQRPVMQGRVT
jgi:hypothetical protein